MEVGKQRALVGGDTLSVIAKLSRQSAPATFSRSGAFFFKCILSTHHTPTSLPSPSSPMPCPTRIVSFSYRASFSRALCNPPCLTSRPCVTLLCLDAIDSLRISPCQFPRHLACRFYDSSLLQGRDSIRHG